jgi:hypothetical protein
MRQIHRRDGVQDGVPPSIQLFHRQSAFHVMVQQRRKACVALVVPNPGPAAPDLHPVQSSPPHRYAPSPAKR